MFSVCVYGLRVSCVLLHAPNPAPEQEFITSWRAYSECFNSMIQRSGCYDITRVLGWGFWGPGAFSVCNYKVLVMSSEIDHLLSVLKLLLGSLNKQMPAQTYALAHSQREANAPSCSLTIYCTHSQAGLLFF